MSSAVMSSARVASAWDHAPERMVSLEALGERLRCLRLCAPESVQRMQESLARHGQLAPLAVHSGQGGLEVIDGFRRLFAARQLGWMDLRVRDLELDGVGAKLALLLLNEGEGLVELEEAWLVQALYREERLSQPAIGQLLGRDKSWVSRRLALAEGLCDVVCADVRLGLLSARAGAEVARLSRDNQEAAAEVVVRNGMTCVQTGRLVAAVLACPTTAARTALLREQLESQRPLPPGRRRRTRRQRTVLEEMLADVGLIARTSGRLQARLYAQPLAVLGERAAALAGEAISGLLPVLRALERTCERITVPKTGEVTGEATCDDPGEAGKS